MIAVVGSYNVDVILRVSKIPEIGETVIADEVYITHGGKGSNQAVSASRLGSHVKIIAAVGDDKHGTNAIEFWKSENIDVSKVKIKNGINTGTAYIFVDKKGRNIIVVNRGANYNLSEDDLNNSLEGDILLIQLEIRENVVKKAAKEFNGIKILNPAPANLKDTEILSLVDIITPNEIEFKELVNTDDFEYGLNVLLKKVKKAVIVTLGERGALLATRDGKKVLIPSPKVNVIDETGAGDVFNAALSVYLENGFDLETAVEYANKVAALSVTKIGALGPKLDEVRKFLEEIDNE
ncbi:ribokinase [Saccharolobus islandicus]|uniref:Ribokinase n=1 Tax=Saccharolobus islandicus (strain M.16.4 / Kamchatka \|nr:ribokinase [Sulfolobus islandicus]ACR42720.1 ribokinase [Sulfolobus islandicus M.16.4]